MSVADLIRERLPHAPQMGLYVNPDLPEEKVQRALADYAQDVDQEDVLALYDATLTGTGGDGAVFTDTRVVFQNNDLQAVHSVRYRELVGVEVASRWWGLGGKKVDVTVNRGRATVDVVLDFSGTPDAATYVADVLHEAMLSDVEIEAEPASTETDVDAVRQALDRLRDRGQLTEADYERLMGVLSEGAEGV